MEFKEIGKRLMRLMKLRRDMLWKLTGDDSIHFGQLPILEYIKEHDGCIQSEIAIGRGVTPPTIAASCKRLEQAGLISRCADENDRRINRLYATERGRLLSQKCREAFDETDFRCFSPLTEEEMNMLAELLDKIICGIEVDR
ncbi:MAG: MarR family transcriptional regulator [Clostridia bacterium]|nr:MarR family transcriptional regulator [Clostridia bacterium]